MFCQDGEVVFIHSKQVDKTGSSTLILASTILNQVPFENINKIIALEHTNIRGTPKNW